MSPPTSANRASPVDTEVQAAVRAALDSFFLETVAPLISMVMDPYRDRVQKASQIDGWLEQPPKGPPAAPTAGTWIRENIRHATRGSWHLSSGLSEMPLHGRELGWYRVFAACSRRHYVVVDLPGARFLGAGRRLQKRSTMPTDDVCSKCASRSTDVAR